MNEIRVPLLRPFVSEEAIGLVSACLASGWIGTGPRVEELATQLQDRIQATCFLLTNSGTSALSLAYRLVGISEGDEVISTPMTCLATNLPLLHCGASPVWADISMDGTICPRSVARRVTKKTRAIVATHFGGQPCRLHDLRAVGRDANIPVIEDAAHALEATYKGAPIGSDSDYACFSFQAVKALTTGDGGGLAMRSRDVFDRAKRLTWYGMNRAQDRSTQYGTLAEPGYKYVMNDIAASIGLGNIGHLGKLVARRRQLAAFYSDSLARHTGLHICHPVDEDRLSSYWLFPVLVERKDEFSRHMLSRGVEVSPIHFRNDRYKVFKPCCGDNLPGVAEWEKGMVCLPIGHWVSRSDADLVVDTIREGW